MIEDAGLIKVDLLGLTMLSVIRECLILIEEAYGLKIDIADIKTDDSAVYDMIYSRGHDWVVPDRIARPNPDVAARQTAEFVRPSD